MSLSISQKLSLLKSVLPATGPTNIPLGQPLKDYCILPNRSGYPALLILKHPDLDPDLCRWLQRVDEYCSHASSEEEKVRSAFKFVRRTFSGESWHGILSSPIGKIREVSWKRAAAKADGYLVPIGLRLRYGVGTCIPQAAAMQLALQVLGIDSGYMVGDADREYLDPNISHYSQRNRPHAWVETRVPRLFFVDPAQGIMASHRVVEHVDGSLGKVRFTYHHSAPLIDQQYPLTGQSLRDSDLEMIRGALSLF